MMDTTLTPDSTPKPKASSNAPLRTVVREFLGDQDVARSSRATYERQISRFIEWLTATGRSEHMDILTRKDISAFKDYLIESGLASNSVSGYLSVVHKFYGWLESEKAYPNIARHVKAPKRPRGYRKDALTVAEVRDVLGAIDQSSITGLRNFALVNLLVRTGLRTIEVARAYVGDVRHHAGHPVLWVQGKGRVEKDDFVLLTHESIRPIRTYLSARGQVEDSDPLFCSDSDRNRGEPLTTRSLSRIVKAALVSAYLDSPRHTAHSLRHTAITLAISNGASPQQAQSMARHANITTTMIYAQNLNRVENGAERLVQF